MSFMSLVMRMEMMQISVGSNDDSDSTDSGPDVNDLLMPDYTDPYDIYAPRLDKDLYMKNFPKLQRKPLP